MSNIEQAVDIAIPNPENPREVQRSFQQIIAYLKALGPAPSFDDTAGLESYAGRWIQGEYTGNGVGSPRELAITDSVDWDVDWAEVVRQDSQIRHAYVWRLHEGMATTITYYIATPNSTTTDIGLTTVRNILTVDGFLNTNNENYHYRALVHFDG